MYELIQRLMHRRCTSCERLEKRCTDLAHKFNIARGAQSVQSRKIAAFQADHPELWKQYFARGKSDDSAA